MNLSYNSFANSALLPIVGMYYGSSVKKQINFLNKSQWWSRSKLEKYQLNTPVLFVKSLKSFSMAQHTL